MHRTVAEWTKCYTPEQADNGEDPDGVESYTPEQADSEEHSDEVAASL